MLEVLGLTAITESVYLALLDSPEIGVGDLAHRLGLTVEQIRVSLDDLARMSLLRKATDNPHGLRPVDPGVALGVLIVERQAEIARRQQAIEKSKAAIALLAARHAQARAHTMERLDGTEAIQARLGQLAATCQWEACSLMPGGAQPAASLLASRGPDREAIERGVRMRTVYLESVRNDPATLAYARWLADLGSEVRTVASLPLRMLIVDRRVAIVPANPDETAASALVVQTGGLLAALVALFHSVWRGATPLSSGRRRGDGGLSSQEKQVLRLLGAGLTDEMIARRLGVSVRTARRVAADLLTRLEARSRFQAGARAVQKGWLTVDDLDQA